MIRWKCSTVSIARRLSWLSLWFIRSTNLFRLAFSFSAGFLGSTQVAKSNSLVNRWGVWADGPGVTYSKKGNSVKPVHVLPYEVVELLIGLANAERKKSKNFLPRKTIFLTADYASSCRPQNCRKFNVKISVKYFDITWKINKKLLAKNLLELFSDEIVSFRLFPFEFWLLWIFPPVEHWNWCVSNRSKKSATPGKFVLFTLESVCFLFCVLT